MENAHVFGSQLGFSGQSFHYINYEEWLDFMISLNIPYLYNMIHWCYVALLFYEQKFKTFIHDTNEIFMIILYLNVVRNWVMGKINIIKCLILLQLRLLFMHFVFGIFYHMWLMRISYDCFYHWNLFSSNTSFHMIEHALIRYQMRENSL